MSGALGILDEYRQCSFRGVPFAVIGSGGSGGRKIAVHEYPFRDMPWGEDLGRKGRSFRVRGMVLGPLFRVQFDLVQAAVEQAGPGLLIHPTRGVVKAVVLNFDWVEPDERSGVILLDIEFLEQRDLLTTVILAAAQGVIAAATVVLGSAASADFASTTAVGYALGTPVSGAALATAEAWASSATALSGSPSVTAAALAGLPSYFGRYVSGNAPVTTDDASVADALAAVTNGQAAVALAVAGVSAAGSPADLAVAVQAVPEAVRQAVADPAVQMRLLTQLAAFAPTTIASSAPIGGAIATAQLATAALCRQATLISIALACAAYQPTSYDDAEALRSTAAALFGPEILTAADAGDDVTYQALRALRAQVLKDLASRASQLAQLIDVTRNVPLPACVLGQQLYGDGSRAADLIRRADPIHPAFMPTSFKTLAS